MWYNVKTLKTKRLEERNMPNYAPGMRVIIRDEEWMIKKCDSNSYGSYTLQCVGILSKT